jgi:hypothetical protein
MQVRNALTDDHRESLRLVDGTFVGVSGYHHGEPLEVVRAPDGSVDHLRWSTFVLTRTPYPR